MVAGTWGSTVTIELKGERRSFARITTSRDAASYLVDQWPGQFDSAYKDAILICTKALRGEIDDRLALVKFVEAATVSGLRYMNSPHPRQVDDEFEIDLIEATKQSLANDNYVPSP
ncbi:DUF982 domain-containing protein [Agrobacterium sp. BA1120]|uniref:DUF982 domain-containing protein n=1 Tax=Agrobacterium sp. BA1120 TaxID=3228927 RepID=UPI003369EB14